MNNKFHLSGMQQAISYIRFSSVIQGDGSSTERQESLIHKWLLEHPEFELSKLSAKDTARSGFTGENLRYGLGAILDGIKDKKIKTGDVLLVEAFDRLGRLPPMEMMGLIQQIVNAGVKVITLQDNQEYSQEILNGNIGPLYVLVGKVQQAYEYSKNLGLRISAAYEAKRRKARNGEDIVIATPFWLNTDGTIKQPEGNAVNECIRLYLKGRGTRRILLELREKYPQLEGVHPTTLKRWFKNRALIGEWENKGDPIRGVFNPLIDDSTFYALQRELASRAKTMSPEETYSLSGLVVCARCGSRFHYRRKKHKDYVIVYANCSTYLKRGKPHCDNNKTWPYEVLAYIFKKTYRTCLLNIAANRVDGAAIEEIQVLKAKREEQTQAIKRLVDVLLHIPGQLEITDKLKELEMERERIGISLSRLENDAKGMRGGFTANQAMELQKVMMLDRDEIHLRDLLKKGGYSIEIDNTVAQVGHQVSELRQKIRMFSKFGALKENRELSQYELLKRSTRYDCYIIREQVQQATDAGGDNSVVTSYHAIYRDGTVVEASDEDGLFSQLEQIVGGGT